MNSINNFLDETVVLPPGDWDKKNLLSMSEIHELKRKKRLRLAAMERLKHEKEINKQIREEELEKKAVVISEKEEFEKGAEDEEEDEDEEKEKMKKKKKEKDPLVRTSTPFGGVINEVKKRFPMYKSDITDSFSLMCIAAVIFIFFAALSGAIAFGGLYGNNNNLNNSPQIMSRFE